MLSTVLLQKIIRRVWYIKKLVDSLNFHAFTHQKSFLFPLFCPHRHSNVLPALYETRAFPVARNLKTGFQKRKITAAVTVKQEQRMC